MRKITSTPGKNYTYVEVEWMSYAYARPWKLWKDRKGQTWQEKIPLSSVLSLIDFDKLSDDVADRLNKICVVETDSITLCSKFVFLNL